MKLLSGIVLFALLFSCNPSALTPREYVAWMNEDRNGLKITKTIGGYDFTLLYKTPEYIALMEKKDERIPLDSIMKRADQLSGVQHYTFTIKPHEGGEVMAAGAQSEEEYYGRLQYLVESMQDDIILIEGKDTIPCALFHYERNYGISPLNNFVLGFEAVNENEDKVFVFNDRILGTGPVKFTVSANDIRNIPRLKAN